MARSSDSLSPSPEREDLLAVVLFQKATAGYATARSRTSAETRRASAAQFSGIFCAPGA